MRVLFIIPNSLESAVARYRAVHIAESLKIGGIEADIISAQDDAITLSHDVVVLHRIRYMVAAPLIAAAKSIGATTVYGTDDLIFSPEHAYHAGFLHPDDATRFPYHSEESLDHLCTLRACDFALVSTEFLAREARDYSKTPVSVLRNVVGKEILDWSQQAYKRATALAHDHERITLAYLSGSTTHNFDFAEIADALAALFHAHPNVRLMIVGEVAIPSVLQPFADAGRIRRHPFVPWRDLPGLLAFADINLAPLDPSRPFNHAKSEVKWLEASACGVPTVAGWAHGFAEGVRDGECVLVRSAADWMGVLDTLVLSGKHELRQAGHAALSALCKRATTETASENTCVVFAAFNPFKPATGTAVVRRSRMVRLKRAVRGMERRAAEMLLRYRRHQTLLEEDIRRGGTVQ